MAMMRQITGLCALMMVAACSSYDPLLKTGSNDTIEHKIEVVENTVVLEVLMSPAEPGIPFSERKRVEAFLADYKSRGKRHGPLVLSVPQNSPYAKKLERGAQETFHMAYNYGVEEVKRSDYESNGAKEAPMVLAFKAYQAIPPKCRSLATINLANSSTNDPSPNFGCATAANLAAMIADPADLLGARPLDPADLIRRATVLDKYRAGTDTATERSENDSGAISDAVK